MFVILRQCLSLAEKLERVLVFALSYVLDCEHVADVANLNTDLRELFQRHKNKFD